MHRSFEPQAFGMKNYPQTQEELTMTTLYTAHVHVTGGRDGAAKSSDGKLDLKLAPPAELGGNGAGRNSFLPLAMPPASLALPASSPAMKKSLCRKDSPSMPMLPSAKTRKTTSASASSLTSPCQAWIKPLRKHLSPKRTKSARTPALPVAISTLPSTSTCKHTVRRTKRGITPLFSCLSSGKEWGCHDSGEVCHLLRLQHHQKVHHHHRAEGRVAQPFPAAGVTAVARWQRFFLGNGFFRHCRHAQLQP